MTKEIDFSFLLTVLKKAWWKLLLIVLAVAIITFLFSTFFIPKKYTQEVKFYVINNSSTSEYTSNGLIQASIMLREDYIEILKSDVSLKAIQSAAEEQGYDLTKKGIASMISTKTAGDSSIFVISITHNDPKLAFDLANIMINTIPDVIKDVSKPHTTTELADEAECVSAISIPVYHENPSSPNIIKNSLFASLIALVLSYAIFFIIAFFDVTLRTRDDIKKNIKATLIGAIPEWESNTHAKRGK